MDGETEDIGYLLTAYADGALSAEGTAWVERQLAEHPPLRARLAEIRRVRGALAHALPRAPEALSDARLAALDAEARGRARRAPARQWFLRWPAMTAAASIAVLAVLLRTTVVASRSLEYSESPPARSMRLSASSATTATPAAAKEESRLAPDENMRELSVEDSDVAVIGADEASEGQFASASAGDRGVHGGGIAYKGLAFHRYAMVGGEFGSRSGGGRKRAISRFGGSRADAKPSPFPFDRADGDAAWAPDAFARLDELDGVVDNEKATASKQKAANKSPVVDAPVSAMFGLPASTATTPPPPAEILAPPAPPAPPAQPKPTPEPPMSPPALVASLSQWHASSWTGDLGDFAMTLAPTLHLPVEPPPREVGALHVTVPGARTLGTALVAAARSAGAQVRLANGMVAFAAPGAPLDPTLGAGVSADAFYAAFGTRPMTATAEDAKSTFALDQDTASYAFAEAQLEAGRLPDASAIQPEQFVNAMPMEYPPAPGPEAFSVYAEAGPSPFAAGPVAARTCLVAIGVVARAPDASERRPLHLTLAIDCSGSMAQPGALDALKSGIATLLPQLGAQDRVAVVAFADQARVVLPATPGNQLATIHAAIDGLEPAGGTNLAEGLEVAYRLAAEDGDTASDRRVLAASDGGALDAAQATDFAARAAGWRAKGITLIALGCGGEQVHTQALQALADHADGQHFHIADAAAARELFTHTLVPGKLGVLARDAKVQVTWDPARVSHFRLIGFDDRRLEHEQFRDDTVDAGELAEASQTTALYEIVLADGAGGPLGTAGVRYFDTRRGSVRELTCPLPATLVAPAPSPRLELAACAAEFAELLQHGWWANARCATLQRLRARLAQCRYRSAGDLLALVDRAIALEKKP